MQWIRLWKLSLYVLHMATHNLLTMQTQCYFRYLEAEVHARCKKSNLRVIGSQKYPAKECGCYDYLCPKRRHISECVICSWSVQNNVYYNKERERRGRGIGRRLKKIKWKNNQIMWINYIVKTTNYAIFCELSFICNTHFLLHCKRSRSRKFNGAEGEKMISNTIDNKVC